MLRAMQCECPPTCQIIQQTWQHLEYRDIPFDFVITVCDNAKERCPFFPSTAKKFHHNFPDPAKANGDDEQVAQAFREVRGMIKDYSRDFVAQNL